MAKAGKYYVVWVGREPGLYRTWASAEQQIKGFAGALFKSFATQAEAEAALAAGPGSQSSASGRASGSSQTSGRASAAKANPLAASNYPKGEALCVDAAWNSVQKQMEYQGVWLSSGELLFHQGPFAMGTNNIGEFLALVHALAWLDKQGDASMPVYTDSMTAMAWVRKKKANSQSLAEGRISPELVALMTRAEHWLQAHPKHNPVKKWLTKEWGEIPADFGRK